MSVRARSRVRIGCAGYAAPRARYQEALDLVEVQETFVARPRAKTLARWRQAAPPGFSHTMRAWQVITHPAESPTYRRLPPALREKLKDGGHFRDSGAVRAATEATLRAAQALGAEAILFETPASFTPTRLHRAHLVRYFETLARPEGIALVWRAGGVWGRQEMRAVCRDLSLVPAFDETDAQDLPEVEGPAYLRLEAPRHDEAALARMADALLAAAGPVFCVVASGRPFAEARTLAGMVAAAAPPWDDDVTSP